LPLTRQRLGEVAASTKRYAAHGSLKFALPLLRASAAIASNRLLGDTREQHSATKQIIQGIMLKIL